MKCSRGALTEAWACRLFDIIIEAIEINILIWVGPFRRIFHHYPLGVLDWVILIALIPLLFLADEARKFILRVRDTRRSLASPSKPGGRVARWRPQSVPGRRAQRSRPFRGGGAMRAIIAGCGIVGALLASRFQARGHEIVVIDKDPAAFERLSRRFRGTTLRGISFDKEVLDAAGADRTDVFMAVTSGDNSNVVAAIVARNIYRIPKVVARIFDPRRAETGFQVAIGRRPDNKRRSCAGRTLSFGNVGAPGRIRTFDLALRAVPSTAASELAQVAPLSLAPMTSTPCHPATSARFGGVAARREYVWSTTEGGLVADALTSAQPSRCAGLAIAHDLNPRGPHCGPLDYDYVRDSVGTILAPGYRRSARADISPLQESRRWQR